MADKSRKKRAVVAGGAGFLGRQVCRLLLERGVPDTSIVIPRRRDFDLTREADYFQIRPSFERPYGWGWALTLAAELDAWSDAGARGLRR